MDLDTHAAKFRRWMRPAWRSARHWLLYICAASQMADLSAWPLDEKTVDRYLGRERKLY